MVARAGLIVVAVASLAAPVARAQSAPDPWAPGTQGAAPPPAAPAAAGAPPAVWVTVAADQPGAVLVRHVAAPGLDTAGGFQGQVGQTTRVPVCKAPCGMYVPAGATYAVGGTGYRQSPGFELTGRYPRVKVAARMGTENGLIGGIVLAAAGGFVGLVGLALVPVGFIEDSNGLKVAGGVAFGAGLAGLITGISMAAGSETKIEVQQAAVAPARRGSRAAIGLTPFGFVF
jgi:hypothetical protein